MRLDRSGGDMAAARLPNLIHNATDFGSIYDPGGRWVARPGESLMDLWRGAA